MTPDTRSEVEKITQWIGNTEFVIEMATERIGWMETGLERDAVCQDITKMKADVVRLRSRLAALKESKPVSK